MSIDRDTISTDVILKSIDNAKLHHENECKISSLNELSIADHAIIVFNEKIYCHCIIENVNLEKNEIDIIFYDDGEFECGIDEYLKDHKNICSRKPGTKKVTLCFDYSKFEIFKVTYSEDENCLKSDETILKANEFVGRHKYNVFENNDEHFAIYCKTGKAGKLFLIDPKDLNPNEVFGGNIFKKLTGNLAQAGTNVILVNTAKHIASRFPRSVASAALPAVAEAAGSVIGIGIEGITMGYDIHKKYKDNKEGKLSTIKFKKYIAKRVTRGVVGVAGGIGGGILGQMIIPVPVVGAVVGGFVGGLFGAALGHGQGILIGEIVEKIDTKVKEKKEKENNEKQNYTTLSHLVIKYDKDLFNEENQDLDINIRKDNFVEEESKPIIKNDDYDIYVINNANDNVPIEESLRNARISTNDIELPLDLDVYISLNPQNK